MIGLMQMNGVEKSVEGEALQVKLAELVDIVLEMVEFGVVSGVEVGMFQA